MLGLKSKFHWTFADQATIWASLAYAITLLLPGDLLRISRSTRVLRDIFGGDLLYGLLMMLAALHHVCACFLQTGSRRRIFALSVSMLIWGITLGGYVAGYPQTGAWGATGGILIVYVHLIRYEFLASGSKRRT